jgi:hypothetical protein
MPNDENKDMTEELQEKIDDLIAEAGSLGKSDKATTKQVALLIKDVGVLLRSVAGFSLKHAEYVEETFTEYDERLDALEGEETRISVDDAQKINEHLMATNDVLRKLLESTPVGAPGRDVLATLLENGELLIEVVKDHTIEADDDDDDDDDDEEEEEEENKKPSRH